MKEASALVRARITNAIRLGKGCLHLRDDKNGENCSEGCIVEVQYSITAD